MAGTAACGKNTATVIGRFVGECDTVAIGVVGATGAIIGTIRKRDRDRDRDHDRDGGKGDRNGGDRDGGDKY
jgi:hypothetical protein